MDFLDPNIQAYCDQNSSPEPEYLKKLNRYTHAHVLQPRMLSGHFQGRVLAMISHLLKPKHILEIGTYTGYSALCLAEGLTGDGRLTTIDVNPELEDVIRGAIAEAGMENKIRFIIGDAFQIIRTLPEQFDLIFIDADKQSYPKYYEQALEKLVPGGFILIDNVLWSGKVVDAKSLEKDKDTKLLNELNQRIAADTRVEKVLLPIRDGLFLIRKR